MRHRRSFILGLLVSGSVFLSSCAQAPTPSKPRAKTFRALTLLKVIQGGPATAGPFREPSCVRSLGDGSILFTDTLNNRVVRMGLDGRYLGAVGSYGDGPGQFDHPRLLSLAPWKEPLMLLPPGAGNYPNEASLRAALRPYPGPLAWICDNAGRLRILTPDLKSLISGMGFEPEDLRPWSAELGSQGDLVLMERSGRVTRLELQDLEGPRLRPAKILARFGGSGAFPGRFRNPLQIRALKDGSLLVLDTGHGLIQRFNKDGGYMNAVGKPGYGAGGMIAPCDAAMDGEGRLFVSDLLSPLIEVFLPSGPYLFSLDPRKAAGAGTHPSSVSVDRDGSLIISDRYRGRILVMREMKVS